MGKSKMVLGKGLEALIPTFSMDTVPGEPVRMQQESVIQTGTAEIPIDRIQPNPYQPREDFEPVALEELRQSIVEHGVVQPITVRIAGDGYELIAGERRLRAARAAGLRSIPAFVKEVRTDEELLELALIENVQREHLNPIEVATGYQRLIDECRLTQEDVAKKVSKDRTTVANLLRLLNLPAEIQDSVRRNEITMGHARTLVSVPTREAQISLWERIVVDGLSVRRAESLARDALQHAAPKPRRGPKLGSAVTPPATSAPFLTVASRLRQALATQVRVRDAGDGKGEIVIEFYSDEDLERLLDIIESASR